MQLGPDTPPSDSVTTGEQSSTTGSAQASSSDVGTVDPGPQGNGGLLDRFGAENSMLPNILIIGAMVILVFLMMRTLRKTAQANKARGNAMGTPSERIGEIRERATQSMEPGRKAMVDAEEIARRIGAALDNKAARLELLIEEADTKLDQLNRAIARSEGRASTSTQSDQPSPSRRAIDPALLDRARLEQDIEERQSRVNGYDSPERAPEPATQERLHEPEPEISISDRIHKLALAGKSSKEIASELNQPIGQVELIMNLQKRAERS